MNTLKSISLYLFGAATVIGLVVLTSYTDGQPQKPNSTTTNADKSPQTDEPIQQVRVPEMPGSIEFAGTQIAIDEFDIHERIDRELLSTCFQHSNTIGILKRAPRIFAVIEPILKKNGLPDDFKYLAVTESNLMELVSPAGAAGIWQFMKATAIGYGLEVNDEIDERYHLEKVTEAACTFLLKAKTTFGDWLLAAASYNMGGGGLSEDMASQKMTTYFDLHLNRETSRYVPRILAIKEVMQHPEKYGIIIKKEDAYPLMPEFKFVKVSDAVASWADFAKENNISYRTLKLYNGWIRGTKLTNKYKKTYEVKVPL